MVYLKNPQDAEPVHEIISGLKGVDHVIIRSDQAAARLQAMNSRIGDLCMWGEHGTVLVKCIWSA